MLYITHPPSEVFGKMSSHNSQTNALIRLVQAVISSDADVVLAAASDYINMKRKKRNCSSNDAYLTSLVQTPPPADSRIIKTDISDIDESTPDFITKITKPRLNMTLKRIIQLSKTVQYQDTKKPKRQAWNL